MNTLIGAEVAGRPIRLDLSGGKPKEPREPSAPSNTVFLGNCSFDITDDAVREAFAECGEITNVRWQTDRDTGRFKG